MDWPVVLLETRDFPSDHQPVFNTKYKAEWDQLEHALSQLVVHLKPSDQAGMQGNPIFDVVGTNAAISAALGKVGWKRLALPTQYKSLGTGMDFVKNGLVMEAQFSNYPFLINNVLRVDYLHSKRIALEGVGTIEALVMVTKGGMFPASNSTLYYEQAVSTYAYHFPFTLPTRLVGLQEVREQDVQVHYTEYTAKRYSRVVANHEPRTVRFVAGRGRRCRIEPH